MANLKLVSSEYNSVALYYILTSIEEVVTNGAEVEGNLPLVAGSLAYDKFQQVYCFDGENWVKDDGTTIPNSAGGMTKFAEFTFTGENAGSIYIGQAPCSFPCLENLKITFDGVDYEVARSEMESFFVYGEFSGEMPVFTTYPFAVISSGMIMVADGDEHTLSISGDVSFTELVADESVTISGSQGQISESVIIEAGKSYKLIFDEYVWYGTCDSNLDAKFYNNEDSKDYTLLRAGENTGTGMTWPINGTYTISLYEMVE